MIPKSPTSSSTEFNNFVAAIRNQFSSSNAETVKDIKLAFNDSSHEVVESVDQVRMTNEMGTENVISNIRKNAENILHSLGRQGTRRLVDISYDMLDQSNDGVGLLKDIKDIQLNMGSRSGLWGTFLTWMKSFQPFTNERRQKMVVRQRIAQNRLLKLTYLEQMATRELLYDQLKEDRRSRLGDKEAESERMRMWSKLFGSKDGQFVGTKYEKWLSPKSFMQQLLNIMALSATAVAALALTYVTRFKQFGQLTKIIGNQITKWFMSSKIGTTIGAIFLETVAKFGNLVDKSARLKKITDVLLNVFDGRIVSGFVKGAQKIKPIFTFIGKASQWIAKGVKFLPLLGRAFATAGKFVPFLNIAIGAYELVRGAFKGAEKIGGFKGIVTGLIGGIFEFFTLGIFDIDTFLETAKGAFDKFQNGEFLAGMWELIKAPFNGMKSGVSWLLEKLMGGNIFTPDPEAGLVGKTFFYLLTPWRLMFTGVTWLIKKIKPFIDNSINLLATGLSGLMIVFDSIAETVAKTKNFFAEVISYMTGIIDNPIATIKSWIMGANEETAQERAMQRNAPQNFTNLYDSLIAEGHSPTKARAIAREKQAEDIMKRGMEQRKREQAEKGIMGPMPQPQPMTQNIPQKETIILPSDTAYSTTEASFVEEKMRFIR